MRTTNTKSNDKVSLSSSSLENLAYYNASFLDEKSTLEEIVATNEKYLSDLSLSLSKEFELNQVILKNDDDLKHAKQRIFLKRKSKNKVYSLLINFFLKSNFYF